MIVKICGMARDVDIAPAIAAGATHLGMIFAPASPRAVPIEDAIILRRVMPDEITPVGVFKDQPLDAVIHIAHTVGLSWVQLHGGFQPEDVQQLHQEGLKVIWATPVQPNGEWDATPSDADLLLLDTAVRGQFGGSGEPFEWARTRPPTQPFLVAGGIAPHNARRAIDAIPSAAGIDMSSGVEAAPGIKSHALLRDLGGQLRPIHSPLSLHDSIVSSSTEASS